MKYNGVIQCHLKQKHIASDYRNYDNQNVAIPEIMSNDFLHNYLFPALFRYKGSCQNLAYLNCV
jgi:hypothetical protein